MGHILMGGTVIMLWLANEIRVTELGRRITMRFAPEVVPERHVQSDISGLVTL